MDQKQRDKIDQMILNLPRSGRKRILSIWRKFAKSLPEDGKRIMMGEIRWLKKSLKRKRKK